MKKNLIIIGARGWGREVLWSFQSNYNDKYNFKGFLDSKSDALDGLIGEFPPIICSVEDYIIQPGDVFFCALGDPKWRKHYSDIIESKGGEFITYISPLAIVSPNAIIGEGTFIGANTVVSDNVKVGKHSMIHGLCTLGHDVTIGTNVSVEAYCFFGGFSTVCDNSSIHVRSTVIAHKKVGFNASVGACSLVIRNVKDNTHVFGNPAKRID